MQKARVRASIIAAAVILSAATASEAAAQQVNYVSRQQTGLARANCPGNAPVLGGGAFVETHPSGAFQELSLRQTHPISDKTGVIAFGSTAIGWQAASSNFSGRVAAFVTCADKALADAISVQYVSGQAIGMARAFCPAGTKVIGGGGFVEALTGAGINAVKLRQTHPISDDTGVIAYGTNAIGWQAASSNFEDTVVAFAVCAAPTPGATLDVQYHSSQATGVARAVCPANTTVTGGGAFVETTPFGPVSLRQTYPISDMTGVIAHGKNAIGWQAASSNFQDTVVSFAICTTATR